MKKPKHIDSLKDQADLIITYIEGFFMILLNEEKSQKEINYSLIKLLNIIKNIKLHLFTEQFIELYILFIEL